MVEKLVHSVYDTWGRTDVLVNNAPAENISGTDYRRVLEVNLVAPFLLAKAFGTRMLAVKRGCIVNVASVAGLVGIADRAAYNASKHGLIGLTRTLAAEWGRRELAGSSGSRKTYTKMSVAAISKEFLQKGSCIRASE